ncbi:hypothetical protein NliqN6_5172 [Naganishia liquefaciens]|uniref:Probable methionine--tRNA ligase, mitochondrial n=1 Tax=Naganishia liquefaciens TaxID=104408 RepID=A0A8H3TXQ7_9TREE|nr:hypothetical protein NliqN6_5172 [Naganishia liquefaciens]
MLARRPPVPRLVRQTHSSAKPYYVTTPIFYVNASPHIGHLHSLLLADTLARYARLRRPDTPVRFATGTDEHGLKIQQAAERAGVQPGEFCDEISRRFRELARVADASNTDFVRTTSAAHRRAVQHFWKTIERAGYIYKGSHSGWYAVSDECFYTDSQVQDAPLSSACAAPRKIAIESGSAVEWTSEENYKFRLSALQPRLLDWLATPGTVFPDWRRHELITALERDPLPDLSISRPRQRLSWGIEVPGDAEHTIYVWVDALTNYLTVLGYPFDGQGQAQAWPADVQVVGKDIVRFHTIYWPALLMAANLPPPRQVLAHAHWTMGNAKMSKSRGNVADPLEIMRRPGGVGVDGLRWYLMRNGGALPNDADFSQQEVVKGYTLLASRMGNLVGRIGSAKIQKRFLAAAAAAAAAAEDVHVLVKPGVEAPERALWEMLDGLKARLEARLDRHEITAAMQDVIEVILEANRLFTLLQPWTPSTPPADLLTALTYAHDSLRLAGIALQPVMPTKMPDLLDRLGVDARGWDELDTTGNVARVRACVQRMVEGAKRGKREVLFPPLAESVADEV